MEIDGSRIKKDVEEAVKALDKDVRVSMFHRKRRGQEKMNSVTWAFQLDANDAPEVCEYLADVRCNFELVCMGTLTHVLVSSIMLDTHPRIQQYLLQMATNMCLEEEMYE